jgi:hypothetical protein
MDRTTFIVAATMYGLAAVGDNRRYKCNLRGQRAQTLWPQLLFDGDFWAN